MSLTGSINDDCWRVVFDYLHGEFRTLTRLMQVSRRMLHQIAPFLYGHLGDPSHRKRIDHLSKRAHAQLCALILTSCGVIRPSSNGATNTMSFDCPLIFYYCYKLPLAYNYATDLKQLPWYVFGKKIQDRLMRGLEQEDAIRRNSCRDCFTSFVGFLTEVEVTTKEGLKQWALLANHLSQLSKLTIEFGAIRCDRERRNLLEFVNRHKRAFSGKLKEVFITWPDSTELRTFPLICKTIQDVNYLVEPTKLCLLSFDSLNIFTSEQTLHVCKRIESIEIESGYIYADNTYATCGQFFQQCRQLKSIKLSQVPQWSVQGPIRPLMPFFTWATRELNEFLDAEATRDREQQHRTLSRSSQRPLPSRVTSADATTTMVPKAYSSLVQLEEFEGANLFADIFVDVLSGFRFTLKKLDFKFQPMNDMVTTSWGSWTLPRLTTLSMSSARIAMLDFELCPVLENLTLSNIYPSYSGGAPDGAPLRMPNTLRRLHLQGGFVMRWMNPDSFGGLNQLEVLYLHDMYDDGNLMDGWLQSSGGDYFLTWSFPKLSSLTLGGGLLEGNCPRILLQAAPNLESFATGGGTVFSSPNWFSETPWESYTTVAQGQPNQSLWIDHPLFNLEQPAVPNMYRSKIKSLALWDSWTKEQFLNLVSVLKSTMRLSSPSSTSSRSLPYLKQVEFLSSFEVEDEPGALDTILRILIQRPRMRRILSHRLTPSRKFIELEQLKFADEARVSRYGTGVDLFGRIPLGDDLERLEELVVSDSDDNGDDTDDCGEEQEEEEQELGYKNDKMKIADDGCESGIKGSKKVRRMFRGRLRCRHGCYHVRGY